jgi:hypothetical protein
MRLKGLLRLAAAFFMADTLRVARRPWTAIDFWTVDVLRAADSKLDDSRAFSWLPAWRSSCRVCPALLAELISNPATLEVT